MVGSVTQNMSLFHSEDIILVVSELLAKKKLLPVMTPLNTVWMADRQYTSEKLLKPNTTSKKKEQQQHKESDLII